MHSVHSKKCSYTWSSLNPDRALRLAWTLADLYGHTSPDLTDMAQAISLRTRI
ncbi:hypothetical protein [Gardnerella vaginalis]|uniref:Mg chelatase-related protein C-terminal domain-containing protein n=1 Tax=Gardnerella vaginalis TaxID=2702 RepID=A0AAW6Y3R1_GARVA|nr:hypothetical protein [Gardnerella vaginalis]